MSVTSCLSSMCSSSRLAGFPFGSVRSRKKFERSSALNRSSPIHRCHVAVISIGNLVRTHVPSESCMSDFGGAAHASTESRQNLSPRFRIATASSGYQWRYHRAANSVLDVTGEHLPVDTSLYE